MQFLPEGIIKQCSNLAVFLLNTQLLSYNTQVILANFYSDTYSECTSVAL